MDTYTSEMIIKCIIYGIGAFAGAFGHFLIKDIIPKDNAAIRADWSATWISKIAILLVCAGIIAYKCLTDSTITLPEAILGGYASFSLGDSFKSKLPKQSP